jgi:glycosyltransferase involved in cell wall biosynthesis
LFGNASQKIRQYIACGKPVISGSDGNEFLVEEQLGSNVDPNNIEEIASAVNYWLAMNREEEKAHSERAYQYALRNLSVENAIQKRVAIWNHYVDLYE